jgi:hypothetical protein
MGNWSSMDREKFGKESDIEPASEVKKQHIAEK